MLSRGDRETDAQRVPRVARDILVSLRRGDVRVLMVSFDARLHDLGDRLRVQPATDLVALVDAAQDRLARSDVVAVLMAATTVRSVEGL